jgi:DNA-binding MarR family transcriptional regulator
MGIIADATTMRASASNRGPPDVLRFLQHLWALDHALQALSKRMLRLHGVTGPQRLLLRVIDEHAGCSPGQAARFLRLHPATVTRLAARLAEAGLIQRVVDAADARRVRLTLTPRGERIDRLRGGTVEKAVQTVLRASPPHRVRQAKLLLAALTARLSRAGAPGAAGHPAASRRRGLDGPAPRAWYA